MSKPVQGLPDQTQTSAEDYQRLLSALRESDDRVRLILASASEAIFGCDQIGTCIFCNEAAARALGYDSASELIGKNMHETEHHTRADGSSYPLEECPIYLGFKDGKGIHRDDEVFWRKDGTSFPVEYWSHVMAQDDRTLCVVAFTDITPRKHAEEALRKSEEFKTRLIASSNDCIKVLDLEGRLLSMNEGGMQALEICDLDSVVNSSWVDFWEGEDREAARAAVETASDGGTGRFTGYFPTRITKQPRWWDVVVSPIRGLKGKPEFLVAVSRDITEHRQNEKALRESEQRNRTLLEINNAIITNLTREVLFRSVSEALLRVMTFDRSALALYEPLTDSLRFVAFTGNQDRLMVGDEFKRTKSSVGWVFDHKQLIVRGDLEKEAQYPNERQLFDEGMRSHCIVPLMARGTCIGTLNIASSAKFQYSDRDAEFLQEAANQVALAVENMRSYEDIADLRARLEEENMYLQEEIRTEHNFEEIVGNSPALLAVLEKVEQVAPTDSTVLIYGETGTGKELIARAIHDRSARKNRPLVKVNCSAISAGLVESELFGHVKGAFTGALDRRTGRFELADGGTIFLDEVGELPLETQVKLLRVLQEREFEPVGSSRPLRVNVRVIAATNRNLDDAIQTGRFRSDLFYRLNVFPLEVPPLRERPTDIPKLAKFFLSNYSRKLGKNIDGLTQSTMDRMLNYSWPGNIRELQNVVERAVVLSKGRTLELPHELAPNLTTISANRGAGKVSEGPHATTTSLTSPLPSMKEVERNHIVAALKLTSGVIEGPKGAAKILHLHPNTLRNRMAKLGIKRADHQIS